MSSLPFTHLALSCCLYILTIFFTFRNQNSIARTQNSMVAFSDRELTALVNPSTSQNIPDFPRTAATLSRMTNAAVNRVLLGLELSTEGSLEDKRDRIRVAIGMRIGGV